MELDDTVATAEDSSETQRASKRWADDTGDTGTVSYIDQRSGVKKRIMVDAEEYPPDHEPPPEHIIDETVPEEDNSLVSENHFKLQMSGTEDEDSGREDGGVAAQNRLSMERTKSSSKKSAKKVKPVKRKLSLSVSDNDEYLLGFTESGEPFTVKELNEDIATEANEENALSKITSSRLTKKMKQKKQGKAARKKRHSPPKDIGNKVMKIEDKIKGSSGKHIVGDTEEMQIADTITKSSTINESVQQGLQANTPPQAKKPLTAQDDFYKRPFEYGWKRELVWRTNVETSKEKADVYFITPGGKKVRTRSDILPLLEGDLTIDHFSFAREPLGVSTEYETVRSAKPSSRASVAAATLAAAPSPINMGKRVSKPKGPKGASPPPQGWTPARALKVNNAALLSSSSSSKLGGTGTIAGTASIKSSNASSANSGKSGKIKKHAVAVNVRNLADVGSSSLSGVALEPCSIKCAKAAGQIPQLKCVKCLCLFHHECVGLNPSDCGYRTTGEQDLLQNGREYICEICLPVGEPLIKKSPIFPRKSSTAPPNRGENKHPQTIAVVKGRKYVMVAKPKPPPIEQVSDIENDLKQINESIRKNIKMSTNSLDTTQQAHGTPPVPTQIEQPSNNFATNLFANISYAYDALLCILKYLKIHERARAASVCKLWHLAAKDTSLWQTVRMKNSRVSSWAGFAAALRRGETKHLDLRKMLVPSTRSEEFWQDFSEHIGTCCSLEIIHLCRCSSRVVENLFQSNPNLRALNAVAINDETINLENLCLLTKLEELRLRTCEPGEITSTLQPLQGLTQLTQLSLTSVRFLGSKGIDVLCELTELRSLELGECGDFDSTFATVALPKLRHLQRIRLENGQETSCCALEIIDAIANLPHLSQLELINFDIKTGFDEKLYQCDKIRKLLIIPTYISQSATTNQIVLNAVQQAADTLQVFTWGVTVELLRVTALYVDQCEESTKKEKHHFDECIPVLKPVPGAPTITTEDDKDSEKGTNEIMQSDVPQIEILPLDKVETILGDNLPNTKFTIVKVPYHATCKQQLVE